MKLIVNLNYLNFILFFVATFCLTNHMYTYYFNKNKLNYTYLRSFSFSLFLFSDNDFIDVFYFLFSYLQMEWVILISILYLLCNKDYFLKNGLQEIIIFIQIVLL